MIVESNSNSITRERRLALMLQSVADLDMEEKSRRADYNKDRERLLCDIAKLRHEILTGQVSLLEIRTEETVDAEA